VHSKTDYESMAAIYDPGRALPLQAIDAWREALAGHVSPSVRTIVDLGAGTGLWAEAMIVWFGIEVVGVEPSDAMRRIAAGKDLGPLTLFVGGRAEQIPLREASCDSAWLSTVVHHIGDLPACAAELRRVLAPRAPVLIRNSFGDRLEGIHWIEYFPTARDIASRRWPSVASTIEVFVSAGFELETLRSVPEIVAPDLRAYHKRIAVRANSTLTLISDDEFHSGLERLAEAAAGQSVPAEVVDRKDLLVLQRA
jgi:ubiquinone/menaquinone biosynthesis C-methylase UbiE